MTANIHVLFFYWNKCLFFYFLALFCVLYYTKENLLYTSCVLWSPGDLVREKKSIKDEFCLQRNFCWHIKSEGTKKSRSGGLWVKVALFHSYISLHKESNGGTLVRKSLLIVSSSPAQHWLVWFWMVNVSLFNQPMDFMLWGTMRQISCL